MNNSIPYEARSSDFNYTDFSAGNHRLAFQPHLHYHIEFIYMIEGHTECRVGSSTHTIESGDFIMIFPNQVHSFVSSGPEKYYIFIINPDLTPELSIPLLQSIPTDPVIKNIGSDDSISVLLHQLMHLDAKCSDTKLTSTEEKRHFLDMSRKGILLAFFSEVLSRYELRDIKRGAGSDSRALRAIVNYCAQNFSRDLSLATLEEELHLNRYYISHLFSSHMSMRFNDYVNSLRIYEACKYLRLSDMSVTEISALVGFGTPRTFNRAFRKQMDTSPLSYRLNPPSDLDENLLHSSIPVLRQ